MIWGVAWAEEIRSGKECSEPDAILIPGYCLLPQEGAHRLTLGGSTVSLRRPPGTRVLCSAEVPLPRLLDWPKRSPYSRVLQVLL